MRRAVHYHQCEVWNFHSIANVVLSKVWTAMSLTQIVGAKAKITYSSSLPAHGIMHELFFEHSDVSKNWVQMELQFHFATLNIKAIVSSY